MKKLLLSFLVLFLGAQANAQYRFYAGIQGGPKLSFSTTTLNNGSAFVINQSAPGKLKYQLGAIAGYHFPNSRFSVETGYSINDHAMIAQFNKMEPYPEPPVLKFNYGTEQIHLLFKSVLSNPEAKIRIKFSTGAAWIYRNYGVQFDDRNIYNSRRKSEPYVFPYTADRPENFSFYAGQSLHSFNWSVNKKWLLLTGFEAEINITSRFILNLSLQYQTSIRPVQAFGFEYNYNFQRNNNRYGGVFYEPMQYGTMQSKAEAFNLNIGITYAFSKRN